MQGAPDANNPGDWGRLGIYASNHSGLPPYAPDMHNVIEQLHAQIDRAMQEDITQNPSANLAFFIDRLHYHFKKLAKKKWAQKALRRLFNKTLPQIVRAGGHWGPHGTR
jgi:hypothetical protein